MYITTRVYVGEDISRIHMVQKSLKTTRTIAVRKRDEEMMSLVQSTVAQGSRNVRAKILLSAFMRGKSLKDIEPNRRRSHSAEGELFVTIELGCQLLKQWIRMESQRIGTGVKNTDPAMIRMWQNMFRKWAWGKE